MAVIEEKTVRREMIKALESNKPPTKGVAHNYMKEHDINDFDTYHRVIEDKFKMNDYSN